jgi:prevent-host-death family protein
MILDMRRISIQDLKAQLSGAVAEAESGATLLITRHNEPVAQLSPARPPHVRRGSRVGTGRLEPAVTRATKGRYLAVLLEDRGGR